MHTTCYDKLGQAFSIRPFHPADRPALERFYADFEPKRAAQGLPPAGPERVSRWLDSVLPHGVHLAALRDGELIGHALVMPTQRSDTAEYAVFLREDVRGRGVGTAFNRAALDMARAAGFARLWLSAEPYNRAAIRSYEKVGFRFLPATIYSPELEMELEL